MKKYLVSVKSKRGGIACIVLNSDSLKPFIIRYCGSQVGNNYSTIWGAERELKKLLSFPAWEGSELEYKFPDELQKVGCSSWNDSLYKKGYFCLP